jgi:hypothetical protein
MPGNHCSRGAVSSSHRSARFAARCAAAKGRPTLIWIGTFEPLGQLTGGAFLVADHDANLDNNPRPSEQFPSFRSRPATTRGPGRAIGPDLSFSGTDRLAIND